MLQSTLDGVQAWFDSRQAQGGSRPDRRVVTLEVLEEGRLVCRRRPHEFDLRPGGIINGPALVSFVDAAGWMMVVAHQPPGTDALTTELSMQFLRAAPAGELRVEVKALRVGGRTNVVDATVSSPVVPEGPVAHAVLTYAIARAS